MIPRVPTGYKAEVATTIYDIDDYSILTASGILTASEASLPELSRVLLQVGIDPGADIISIAQDLNTQLISQGVPSWPEYPNQIVFAEGNTLYLTWVKGIVWIPIIIGLLIGLPLIFPIIMYFVSPKFQEIMNMLMMLVIVMVPMMLIPKIMPKEKKE